ncbi:MAG TPA: pyridoxamine 5'-phosphate oxidase family protein [Acidimicrobiia bacterium]|nr:pyridoxamine 5'-phosphate oxidase family protein [Acidimicrobiia bacterium]
MARAIDLPPEAQRRIANDQVVWLTTITDSGAPAPNPVWFVPDGESLVVYAAPESHKVHNIGRRNHVSLHFNSDPNGTDVVVINGDAELENDQRPSALPAYVKKYERSVAEDLQQTFDDLDRQFHTRIRIRPTRVRLTEA